MSVAWASKLCLVVLCFVVAVIMERVALVSGFF